MGRKYFSFGRILWAAPELFMVGLFAIASVRGIAQASQEIPAQSQTGNLTVPAKVMASLCLKMVSPMYAREGTPKVKPATLVLEVIVSRQGTVRPVRLVSGDPTLGDSANHAVRLWRYRPYMQNGVPVDVSTQVNVDFVPGRPGGLISHPTGGG